MIRDFLQITILSYLIGSLSPGYFFGKVVKHIDIRRFGNKNTGAANTYRIVGPTFGILTGIFDFLKAPFVYFLAVSDTLPFASIDPDLAILVGLAAVIGHIKPIYLSFKGGMGVASLLGLCAIILVYTRSVFALIIVTGTAFYTILVSKSLRLTHPLRQILKLCVLSIPLAAIWLPKVFILSIATFIFLFFAVLDIVRLLMPKINQRYLNLKIFAKQKEKLQPSGPSLLFLSIFLVFWLFPKDIAILSLTSFLVGDSLAPIGQRFLPISFIKNRTLGGALIIFSASLISGSFLQSLTSLPLSFSLILFASLVVTVLDQFSFLIDDNLLVPIGTAWVLTFLRVQT